LPTNPFSSVHGIEEIVAAGTSTFSDISPETGEEENKTGTGDRFGIEPTSSHILQNSRQMVSPTLFKSPNRSLVMTPSCTWAIT